MFLKHVILVGFAVYPVVPTFSFSLDSSSRGYHEYQSIWANPPVDDELISEREVGNPHDTNTVAIKKGKTFLDCLQL